MASRTMSLGDRLKGSSLLEEVFSFKDDYFRWVNLRVVLCSLFDGKMEIKVIQSSMENRDCSYVSTNETVSSSEKARLYWNPKLSGSVF